jgi:hypothetical protein
MDFLKKLIGDKIKIEDDCIRKIAEFTGYQNKLKNEIRTHANIKIMKNLAKNYILDKIGSFENDIKKIRQEDEEQKSFFIYQINLLKKMNHFNDENGEFQSNPSPDDDNYDIFCDLQNISNSYDNIIDFNEKDNYEDEDEDQDFIINNNFDDEDTYITYIYINLKSREILKLFYKLETIFKNYEEGEFIQSDMCYFGIDSQSEYNYYNEMYEDFQRELALDAYYDDDDEN